MNMKKKLKKFFTLKRRADEGFTLIELIITVAIIAILGGVGVPAYSGYIEKTNRNADISLASEVAHALSLQYYRNGGQGSGYVVLGVEGSSADNAFGKDAMYAAFGAGWENSVKLKYDGWELSGSMPSQEDAAKVANSTYYQNSTPAELVTSFTGLTDALAGMANTASQDPLDTMKSIGVMTEAEYEAMRKQLDDLEVSWSTEAGANNAAYTTAVSNLLVQNVSTEIGNNQYTGNDNESPSAMAELTMSYALLYGWASTDAEGAEILAQMNTKVSDPNASSSDVVSAVTDAMDAAGQKAGFKTYMAANGQYSNDLSALGSIMGTVSGWSDGADMTAPGLYSSDSITDAVNNYISAVGTMSGMEDAGALAAALGTGVVVFVSPDGTVGDNISLS